jgi:hypothetical protein
MSRYAIIVENVVKNVVVWDGETTWDVPSLWSLVQLQVNETCAPYWTYDENATPRFSAPAPQPTQRQWTAYQFLLRFTAEERAAFRAASLTNANVADFQQLAQAAQEIISDDPMTVAGMDYLVSQGLLTQARRDEILNG